MKLTNSSVSSFAIVLALVMIAANRLMPGYNHFWDILMMLSIVSTGIIHGCFDIFIEHKIGIPKLQSHLVYDVKIVVYGLAWYFFPAWSFVIFMLISAWHFGETDTTVLGINTHKSWYSFMLGLGIIGWMLSNHLADFFHGIFGLGIWKNLESFPVMGNTSILVVNAISLFLIAVVLLGGKANRSQIAETLAFLLAIKLLPFSQAFLLYFGIWHSMHSLVFIKNDIGAAFYQIFKRVAIQLLGFYLLLVVGFVLVQQFLPPVSIMQEMGAVKIVILIIISTLTLPHMSVMHTLFKRSQEHFWDRQKISNGSIAYNLQVRKLLA